MVLPMIPSARLLYHYGASLSFVKRLDMIVLYLHNLVFFFFSQIAAETKKVFNDRISEMMSVSELC